MEVRLIIAGSRTFNNYNMLDTYVSRIISQYDFSTFRIISGGARGADSLGEQYARNHGYNLSIFPADWNKLGKRAGYVRNEQMAQFASEGNNIGGLICFWDGVSKGTGHMINLAYKYNLYVAIKRF